jgi:vancomycin resistance protein YoaR
MAQPQQETRHAPPAPLQGVVAASVSRLRHALLPEHDSTPANVREHERTGMSKVLGLVPRVLVAIAAVLLAAAVGMMAFRLVYSERIYPAVVVGDVNVGGLSISEAETRLTERANQLENGTITFTYQGQTWTPTLAELGATVDLDASIEEARSLGRGGDAVSRLDFTGQILRGDQQVPLRTQVDQGQLNAWFDQVDADINNPAVNAQVVLTGTDVTISPDSTGIVVDRERAASVVMQALSTLQPFSGELPTTVDQPEITASELAAAEGTVREAVTAPVRVTFEGEAWRLEPDILASYLTVETVLEDGTPTAKLAMDTERLAADLRTQFAPEVNREPVNARVGWNDDLGLIALDPSSTGITLKATAFAEAVSASFLGDHGRVDIPVVVTRPEIDDQNLDALGIETRLGRGDSNFAGGAWQRDANIEVGTGLLNGTLVKPGATFSFNQAIGEITEDKGYVTASVVVAERVGKDIGGGICQVSTTVFRAAIYAGMSITEWHPHTYRLRNYEVDGWGPGFDASILQLGSNKENWADLKFENYTDGWLLVEAWTAYPHVIVNIYGKDMGRTVEVVDQWQSDPIVNNEDVEIPTAELPAGVVQQVEWPMDGLEAGFTRVMYDEEGNEVARRTFYTYFKGRGNVYEVGTG